MQRRFKPIALASGLAALALSTVALAQPLPGATFNSASYSNSTTIGPATITPPSAEDRQRLIVDVSAHPVNINLYAGATRVAAKESVTYPAGTYYSFKEAVDAPPLPGLPQ